MIPYKYRMGGLIPLLFFIIFSFCVSADSTILLNEDFSYTDVFTNHGWTYSGGGGDNQTPVNITIFNPSNNLGFGINYSAGQGSGSSYNRYIYRIFPSNYTQRTVSIQWTYYHNNTNNILGTFVAYIRLYNFYGSGEKIEVQHLSPASSNYTKVTSQSLTGFSDCTVGESHYGNHNYELEVDFISGVYNLLVDDVYKCTNQSIGTAAGQYWGAVMIGQAVPSNTYRPQIQWIDDFIMVNSSDGLSPASSENATGQRCVKNEDCVTGYCEAGRCSLAPAGFECDSDTDCVSGECSNGVCNNPTLSQSISNSIRFYFGSDSASLNLVAIIIILGMAVVVGFYLRSGALAILTFYSISILMLTLGILSVFVFFVFIIAGIIIAFVTMFLRSND